VHPLPSVVLRRLRASFPQPLNPQSNEFWAVTWEPSYCSYCCGGKIWKEDDQQFLIEQGKANGDEISFVFNAPEGEDEQILVHSVKLVVVGPTRMQGTLEFEAGGQQVSSKLSFTRDK